MKLQIKVGEDGIIQDVKFKTFGCGSAIASSSYMTERVKGLSITDAAKVKNTEIAKELCLPPVKREWDHTAACGTLWTRRPYCGAVTTSLPLDNAVFGSTLWTLC